MSSNSQIINYLLNLKLADTSLSYNDVRRLEMTVIKMNTVLQQTFPNSDIAKVMQEISQTIMLAREAQIAIRAVQMASGPIGWLYAGVTVAGGLVSGMSILETVTGT